MPENFHGLNQSANGSRGNKTFEEWPQHVGTGTPMNSQLRTPMIAEETRLNDLIQRRIDELLRWQQNNPTQGAPFRSD